MRRPGLRGRIALFFALAGLGGLAAITVGLTLGYRQSGAAQAGAASAASETGSNFMGGILS